MRKTRTIPEVILFVRDTALERRVRQALRGIDLEFSVIGSVEDLRQALRPERPQLLLLEGSQARAGWEAAVRESVSADVPVLALVTRFDSKHFVQLYQAGVHDILSPLLEAHRLRLLVERLLERRWSRRQRGDERALAALRQVGAWLGL